MWMNRAESRGQFLCKLGSNLELVGQGKALDMAYVVPRQVCTTGPGVLVTRRARNLDQCFESRSVLFYRLLTDLACPIVS